MMLLAPVYPQSEFRVPDLEYPTKDSIAVHNVIVSPESSH